MGSRVGLWAVLLLLAAATPEPRRRRVIAPPPPVPLPPRGQRRRLRRTGSAPSTTSATGADASADDVFPRLRAMIRAELADLIGQQPAAANTAVIGEAGPTGTPAALSPAVALRPDAETQNLRVELERMRHAAADALAEAERQRADAQRDRDQAALELGQADRAHHRAQELRTGAESEMAERRRAADHDAHQLLQAGRQQLDLERAEGKAALAERRQELTERRDQLAREAQALHVERDAIARAAADHAARSAELEARSAELGDRSLDLDHRGSELDARVGELDRREDLIAQRSRDIENELVRVADLTVQDARTELLHAVEATSKREAALLARDIENTARAEASDRARRIVVEAVQRVASAQTTETVVSVMALPSDEMKGRIIGREGRNIRAFEATTGVNIVIDDTPEAVLLSCFDPVRRETGRLTLEKLVLDGRIHPHRIEEAFEQSKSEVDELCLRAARDALAEVGVTDLDEALLPTLGRLRYRTSYGQNVLGHLVETAHVAGIMAAELGLDRTLIKRCAFLHDIGKALTHEVEGSHAIIGAELLRQHGESEAVAHAVEAHHNEVQPRTLEAVLTQAADACSAARPGARREALEAYVTRLRRVEEIATARPGVEKVFAMQAGREVRVMVTPTEVDDLAAQVIAREVAKQIEDELTYPGQIRVTVVRETRASETAH